MGFLVLRFSKFCDASGSPLIDFVVQDIVVVVQDIDFVVELYLVD